MKNQGKLVIVVAFIFFLISSPTMAVVASGVQCPALASLITGEAGVKTVTSSITTATQTVPAFCQVNILYGTNANQNINVVVGLPLNSLDGGTGGVEGAWNGRTQAIGGGGCSGSLAVGSTVATGYASAGTDTGHSGGDCTPSVNTDGTYNYQFINDFIRNGIEEEVLFMKSVATSYYGMKPLYNYWNGCSTGGRQGYLIAQELPNELDGILADAPAMYWTRFQTAQMWGQIIMNNLLGSVISAAKLNQATASAVAACDANDGVINGIIDDPRTCTFNATANICGATGAPTTNCLTQTEAQVINMIWDGPRNAKGEKIWFGLDRGTSLTSLNGTTPFSLGPFQLVEDEHNRSFSFTTVSDSGYAQVAQDGSVNIADVTDTFGNLDAFMKHGGKMITYVGANDQLIFPRGVMMYHRLMASRYNVRPGASIDFTGVQRFYRLFRAAGSGHCGVSGSGPFNALIAWVEHGVAPTSIVGTVTAGTTTLLCPYPQWAMYNGTGPVTSSTSFHCGGNSETTSTVCNDVLVQYKHEVNGSLDFLGQGLIPSQCK